MLAALEPKIEAAAALIRAAHFVVALTGAGISTPSGIPDFRSQQMGQWQQNDPMQVASLTAFNRHPERFYGWIRPLILQAHSAQPNPAHLALAELERKGLLKAVITQNIDGLHQRAGSKRVLEVHGSITTLTCPACRANFALEQFLRAFEEGHALPRCPRCDIPLKPDVVLYEEMLPQHTWAQAETACNQADLLLVVGSSLEVSPVNMLPLDALEHQAPLIIANYSPTYLDEQAAVLLPADVALTLPAIVAAL